MENFEEDYLLTDQKKLPSLDDLMRLMASIGGSDMFVSVGAPIKIKINGCQRSVMNRNITTDDIQELLFTRLDTRQNELLEKTKELNCAIPLRNVGRFRLSAFYQRNSQAFVIRFIPPEIPSAELLGLPQTLKDLVMVKRGLLLVCGPTGSGKTTTVASLLNHRNTKQSDHIITIEDPIEFLFRHRKSVVNQREVGTDTLSFEEALRNAMRQAPDVIWIGEIRDPQTMNMAMQYAQSGHLCLATLHANNSYNALNRILGFYPPDQRDSLFADLSASLKAIVSQRLIPTFNGTRAAAIEILMNTTGVADLIAKGKISEIPERMEKNTTDGSQTFESVLVEMVEKKMISVDNAVIYADSPTNLFWRLAKKNLHLSNKDSAMVAGVDMGVVNESGQIKGSEVKSKNDAFANFALRAGDGLQAPS